MDELVRDGHNGSSRWRKSSCLSDITFSRPRHGTASRAVTGDRLRGLQERNARVWKVGHRQNFKNKNFKGGVSKGKEPNPGRKQKLGAYMNIETATTAIPGGLDR